MPARETVPPPDGFGVDFLAWVRRVSEQVWADLDEPRTRDITWQWRTGTTWTGGLDERTVRDLEGQYGVRFPPDHRLFLRTLHSTTPWLRADKFVYDERWDPDSDDWPPMERGAAPGFYDWLRDGPEIRDAMATVADVMRDLPFDDQDWQTTWRDHDPKPALIPIFGHRYVVADETQWVLSIVDEDAIIYAEDLRGLLLLEVNDLLRRVASARSGDPRDR